jgi:hypothetical protein
MKCDKKRLRVKKRHLKRVKCASCGKDIHIDHFAGVVKTPTGPAFVCDNWICLLWVAEQENKKGKCQ